MYKNIRLKEIFYICKESRLYTWKDFLPMVWSDLVQVINYRINKIRNQVK